MNESQTYHIYEDGLEEEISMSNTHQQPEGSNGIFDSQSSLKVSVSSKGG